MTIRATYAGPECVEHAGEAYTGPNAEGDLARTLIGQGTDPATSLVFERNGVGQLRGSVGAFAARAYSGGDATATRWVPHPRGSYAPRLVAWHAQRPPKAPRRSRVAPDPKVACGEARISRLDCETT